MKKLLSLCMALMFAIGISGCGNNNEQQMQAAEKTVTSYMDSLQAGNLDKAEDLTTDSYVDPFGVGNMEEYMDSLLDSLDMGETFDKEATDFANNAVKAVISSYEIKDTKMDDAGVTVFVDVVAKDYENIDFASVEGELNTYIQNYATENQQRLAQIYLDQGEDAMMEAMMQDVGGYMFDKMEALFTGAKEKSYQLRFDLTQDEEEWRIDNSAISENTEA